MSLRKTAKTMSPRCVWTIISYNWSLGKTSDYTIASSACADTARAAFESTHPGENVIAVLKGTSPKCLTYPLMWKEKRKNA